MNLKTASLAGFLAAVLCFVWLYFRSALLGDGPITIGIQAAAVALMLWARLTFGTRSFHAAANPTAGGLVTHGPYRYLRHPIYAALLYFLWAGIAAHPSASHAVVALVATAGLAVRIAAEEKFLIAQYPEYAAYARRTRRVAPFIF
ncbi:MAG: isoprenylcysteine carboxylmethyltransferase family protein [Acidobacteriota bacterium]|nr:isoprenylcysteine carboxylmethyltransferase family protein [Acidobacteriota bacterium]